jgi:dihydrofolate reductase
MKSFWPTAQAREANPEVAQYMNEMPKLVAAHRPFEPGWTNVTVISGDAVDRVRKLKEGPGSGIVILGSNSLCVSLMQAGLIDELQIMVNPVVLGSGTPLFKGLPHPAKLKLIHARQFESGNAVHLYEPLA